MGTRKINDTKARKHGSSHRGLKRQQSDEDHQRPWKEDRRPLARVSAENLTKLVNLCVVQPRTDGHAYSRDQVRQFMAILKPEPEPSMERVIVRWIFFPRSSAGL